MATTIVVVTSASVAAEFVSAARAAGYVPDPVEGLPRHFILRGVSPSDFSLAGHHTVELVDDGDAELRPGEQQVIVEATGMGHGGWGGARVLRRDDPWDPEKNRGNYPKQSTFDCRRTGAGVDIYMIDAGCDDLHQEFGGRSTTQWWSMESYQNTLDDSGHGTGCMSVAGGSTVGIAREARLISIKFNHGTSDAGTAARAVTALGASLAIYQLNAPDERPGVLFFSWTGFGAAVDSAVGALIDAGMVCCFIAGNDAEDITAAVVRPSESDPDTIVVGGIQYGDYPYYTPASRNGAGAGTNWSASDVDILAPAQLVLLARRSQDGGGYRVSSGTSYAAPVAAGVLACMLQGYKRLTTRAEVQALKAKLLANATTGKLRPMRKIQSPYDWMLLPDRILYLDPRIEFEVIPGLTPRSL